jgi:hypothetical protein
VLAANTDATTTVAPHCTNGTPYNIGLDGGLSGALNPTQRKMTKAAEFVLYGLYRDAAPEPSLRYHRHQYFGRHWHGPRSVCDGLRRSDALARHLQRHDRGDPHLLNTGERASSPLRSSPTDELRASHLRRRCLRQSSTFDPVAGADRSILASARASPTVSCSGSASADPRLARFRPLLLACRIGPAQGRRTGPRFADGNRWMLPRRWRMAGAFKASLVGEPLQAAPPSACEPFLLNVAACCRAAPHRDMNYSPLFGVASFQEMTAMGQPEKGSRRAYCFPLVPQ